MPQPRLGEGMPTHLSEMLARLGSSPDAVAAHLKAEGIRGIRNAVRALNPVVRYAQGHVRLDARSLDVTQGDRLRITLDNGRIVETPLSDPVKEFLAAFNEGCYPELELPPSGEHPISRG
jgi:hypothetical protein